MYLHFVSRFLSITFCLSVTAFHHCMWQNHQQSVSVLSFLSINRSNRSAQRWRGRLGRRERSCRWALYLPPQGWRNGAGSSWLEDRKTRDKAECSGEASVIQASSCSLIYPQCIFMVVSHRKLTEYFVQRDCTREVNAKLQRVLNLCISLGFTECCVGRRDGLRSSGGNKHSAQFQHPLSGVKCTEMMTAAVQRGRGGGKRRKNRSVWWVQTHRHTQPADVVR